MKRVITLMCADQSVEGRLGPQPVVLDHTSGFEGLLFVDDDLLGVRPAGNNRNNSFKPDKLLPGNGLDMRLIASKLVPQRNTLCVCNKSLLFSAFRSSVTATSAPSERPHVFIKVRRLRSYSPLTEDVSHVS